MRHNTKNAFTLIELIIVIVIIGILASMSMAIMKGLKQKAIVTEAVAGLATIRTSLKEYYVEHGAFPPPTYYTNINLVDCSNNNSFPGLTIRPAKSAGGVVGTSSLDGTYFSEECYVVSVSQPVNIICDATGNNQAPKANDIISVADSGTSPCYIKIDFTTGNVLQNRLSASGYPHDPAYS